MTRPDTHHPTTDEWFDAVFCRPLGRRLASVLERTWVTPNGVTFMAGVLGTAAGVAFAGMGRWPLVGAALLLGMMILDCVDGELARLRGGGGWRGRVNDGLADLATAVSIHVGMLVHLIRVETTMAGRQLGGVSLFFIALAAGLSMTWSSAVVDDVKQRLKSDSVDDQLERYASEVSGWFDRARFRFMQNYVRWLARSTGRGRPGGPRCFRNAQWVGPTHHHLAIAVAAAVTPIWPLAFLAYLIIASVPANLWLVGTLAIARRDSAAPGDE